MARKRNSRLKDSGNNMKKSVIIYLSPFTACPEPAEGFTAAFTLLSPGLSGTCSQNREP